MNSLYKAQRRLNRISFRADVFGYFRRPILCQRRWWNLFCCTMSSMSKIRAPQKRLQGSSKSLSSFVSEETFFPWRPGGSGVTDKSLENCALKQRIHAQKTALVATDDQNNVRLPVVMAYTAALNTCSAPSPLTPLKVHRFFQFLVAHPSQSFVRPSWIYFLTKQKSDMTNPTFSNRPRIYLAL